MEPLTKEKKDYFLGGGEGVEGAEMARVLSSSLVWKEPTGQITLLVLGQRFQTGWLRLRFSEKLKLQLDEVLNLGFGIMGL